MSNYVRNGRGSAHSNIPFSAWQRHTPQCEARGFVTKAKGLPCVKCRASDATQEVRFFALAVSAVMTGESVGDVNGKVWTLSALRTFAGDPRTLMFTDPLTLKRIRVMDGQADRIIPGHNGGRYEPGNLAMIAASANLAREITAHDVEAYREAVLAATATLEAAIGVPQGVDMHAGWRRAVKGASTAQAAPDLDGIMSGPYGV